mgnify:FL=1
MKFFNIDMHISIIADMTKIFNDLGHEVTEWSLSNHTWVFNKQRANIPMLDGNRWLSISPQQMSDEFYEIYKDEMKQYDAFIVSYPPPFSLLYKHFDKPIIINNPIRYEWPFSFRKSDWEYFNDYLRDGVDSKKIILVANSMYDKLYMEKFIEREVQYIPSICDYYNQYYEGSDETVLYYSKQKIENITNPKIKWKNDLLTNHKYEDLLKYKGIVHIPYQISYMSVFEQYTANVPLFFPTQKFLMELYEKKFNVLKEVTWNECMGRPPKSEIGYNGEFDPNDYTNLKSMEHWIQFADFYNTDWMPHLNYFDSFEELNQMVNEINYIEVSEKMKHFNTTRKESIYKMWDNLIKTNI